MTRSAETDLSVVGIAARYRRNVDPRDALEQIADALQRVRNARPKVQAFRRAADAVRAIPEEELRSLARDGRLTDLPGIGQSTAAVIDQALRGETPDYLNRLEGVIQEPLLQQDVQRPHARLARVGGTSHATPHDAAAGRSAAGPFTGVAATFLFADVAGWDRSIDRAARGAAGSRRAARR